MQFKTALLYFLRVDMQGKINFDKQFSCFTIV